MTMNESKPLPCPFCGGQKITFKIVEDPSDGFTATPTIACFDCGAKFELEWDLSARLGKEVTDEQKRLLLACWNRRVDGGEE